eukprot:467829-Pyramimonas_sp.AAC.1
MSGYRPSLKVFVSFHSARLCRPSAVVVCLVGAPHARRGRIRIESTTLVDLSATLVGLSTTLVDKSGGVNPG